MKVLPLVLDTNVFVSGIFFGGIPGRILKAWHDGLIRLVVSPAILAEYREIARILHEEHPGIVFLPWLALIEKEAVLVDAETLSEQVCEDRDDDVFLACALAAKVSIICSGDKLLLKTSGYCGLRVLTPRCFVDACLA